MNIIIVGCGKVGIKLASTLNRDSEDNITVIDTNRKKLEPVVNKYDVLGICGSGTSKETLEEAGIKDADLLIAVTGSDEINLLTCLFAKKLGMCKTIARVSTPQFSKEFHLIKDDLGLALAINPDRTAANEIARSIKFPSALQIDTFAKGRVEIVKFKIKEGSPLDNLMLSDLSQKLGCDVLVCGVERGEEAFIPSGNFILKENDYISVVATFENLNAFLKKLDIKSGKVRNTMIVGGGNTAYYLADALIKAGVSVKIIEKDAKRCEELIELLPKATIVNGDGTDNELLLEEEIEGAGSFVSLTNIDEENILLSLFARSKTKGKVITKINRIAYDEVIDNLDLDTTIYPKNLTAEYIIRFVRAMKNSLGSNVETLHYILDEKAEALEFRIKDNAKYTGIPISQLNIRDNTIIACINRKGKVIIPKGQDVILADDTVIVVTINSGYDDFKDIFN